MKPLRTIPVPVRALSLAFLGACCATSFAAVLQEDFSAAPSHWSVYGQTNLFRWSQAAGNLEVTWDSHPASNSFFALPLGRALTKQDDFTVAFDLSLSSAVAGLNPDRPGPFQVSIGLINLSKATLPFPQFVRGTGTDSPDLVEFSFFPDPGGEWKWGPSLTTTIADSTRTNWSWGGFAPLALETGAVYRVTMVYSANDKKLRTNITRDGAQFTDIDPAYFPEGFTDFQVDAFAIASYTEEGQNPEFDGSVLAHGVVDNVRVTLPAMPVGKLRGQFETGVYRVQFESLAGWNYSLQRLLTPGPGGTWQPVGTAKAGTGSELTLEDPAPPAQGAFYRVSAEKL